MQRCGRLDVVVNNAGYANVAPIETGDDADVRAQFETSFWGVYNVSKAAIPRLRAHGGGTVVQFSSVGGRVGGSPGIASYQAAKSPSTGSAACSPPRPPRARGSAEPRGRCGARACGAPAPISSGLAKGGV